jgi:hypothetical protein
MGEEYSGRDAIVEMTQQVQAAPETSFPDQPSPDCETPHRSPAERRRSTPPAPC